MNKSIDKSIAYVTLNGQIPSRTANSVGVMKMCGQFSSQGLQTTLLIPGGQATALKNLECSSDVFDFYSVEHKFKFKYLPNPLFKKSSSLVTLYSLFMVLYVCAKRINLITTRNIEVAFWAALLRKPVIFESHNYAKMAQHRLLPYWIKFVNNSKYKASMVVTTEAGKKSYIASGIDEQNILVQPNGVDVGRFAELAEKTQLRKKLGITTNRKVVGFCGSLYKGRGIEEIMWCAEHLTELLFLIVGGSPEEVKYYQSLAENKKITNIQFFGHVQQDKVPLFLMASDILLMPYTTKTAHAYMSPMKMFDYLATGCPIIATDFPILHEILKDKQNAIFVAPDSGQAMAEGIKWVLNNLELAKKMGFQAKKDAASFSWGNRSKNILNWLRNDLYWQV